MADQTASNEVSEAVNKEKERIMILLMANSARMAAEYKTVIKHTDGLLTQSMVYAYSKGLNDALKLITKDNK